MVKFENALIVNPLDDGKNWLVLQDFYYDTDVVCTGLPALRTTLVNGRLHVEGARIKIPAGFETDFASIPRPLWPIVGGPADGKYRKIAVVHDWLYRTLHLATRSEADSVLLEGMKFSGCSWYERSMIYSGVRIGGWASYKGGF